jgi:glycosyltransferase involved in cell wall biosynthesis
VQMKDISFFCKLPFLNIHPHVPFAGQRRGKLMRISSLIRGQQIAEYIGAKVNPVSGYENDVCIYVKPGWLFNDLYGDNAYIDVVDDRRAIYVLKDHPNFVGIACSNKDEHFLHEHLANKIILIPQHHCNFDRSRNEIKPLTTVGIIGSVNLFPLFPDALKKELVNQNIKLIDCHQMYSRQDVINFYRSIDIQIVWRPYSNWLLNPLKIVNAASFGIPTIALREPGFQEVDDIYFPVNNESEFIEILNGLIKDKFLYWEYSQRCYEMAESYHIDNISKLYRELQDV